MKEGLAPATLISMRWAAVLWLGLTLGAKAHGRGIEYWDFPRQGENLSGPFVDESLLKAVRAKGVRLLRLSPNGWLSTQRDFLLASADEFLRLMPADLERLIGVLASADEQGLSVVLSTKSLPGARFRPQNDGIDDRRLWSEEYFLERSAEFWRRLAIAFKGHPAVVAYDLLDEPHPERRDGILSPEMTGAWHREIAGTAVDLNRFNERLVKAIRAVDAETPILVESGFYASARAFEFLKPLADSKVLYSFHSLPDDTERDFAAVSAWQKLHGIPSSRIVVGESPVKNAALFRQKGWHWMGSDGERPPRHTGGETAEVTHRQSGHPNSTPISLAQIRKN